MAQRGFGGLTVREAQPLIEKLMGTQLNPLDRWGNPIVETVPVRAHAGAPPPVPAGTRPRYAPTATVPAVDPDELTDAQFRQVQKELQDRYRELGYDTDGVSVNGLIWRQPIDSFEAWRSGGKAEAETAARYPGTPHNNEGDAFRHAYWSYLLSKGIGAEAAKQVTDAWERSRGDAWRPGESIMDLSNNRFGRELAAGAAVDDPAAAIAEAIRAGKLVTSPYRFTFPERRR